MLLNKIYKYCNGSGNIIRKVVTYAFVGQGNKGVATAPYVLCIA